MMCRVGHGICPEGLLGSGEVNVCVAFPVEGRDQLISRQLTESLADILRGVWKATL